MTDQRGGTHVSAEDRRYAPEFAEALGLLAAGLLVEGYGDSMSRFEVSGGFTFAQNHHDNHRLLNKHLRQLGLISLSDFLPAPYD